MNIISGDDDYKVTYGHFSEARKVASGPDDTMVTADPGKNDGEFDDYMTKEMEKKKPVRQLKSDRFANSRLKPPGYGKTKDSGNRGGGNAGGGKDKFTNTGF